MSIETVTKDATLQREIDMRRREVTMEGKEHGHRVRPAFCEANGGHLVQMRPGEWPLRKKSPFRPPSGSGVCVVCDANVTAQEHTPAGVMKILVEPGVKRGAA